MDPLIIKIVAVVLVLALIKPIGRLLLRLVLTLVFRRALEGIGARAMTEQPDEIHLTPVADPEEGPEAEALAAALKPHGFQEAGVYDVAEFPGLSVRFLIQSERRVVAALCDHPQAGLFVDLVCTYTDGTSATYTDLRPTGMDARPGNQRVNAPGTSPDALYQRLLAERAQGDLEEWTAENVARKFQDAYARDTAWRKSRGVTAEEVARQIPQALSAET